MTKLITTLCVVHQGDRILIGMKKRGFGAGRWNGFGGKVGKDEMIEEAAVRETREEAGIEILDSEKIGVIDFEFQTNGERIEVNIFKSKNFSGEPSESEEMRPQWFDVDKIPFEKMWPDDRFWMPLFLAGKKFTGRFVFGEKDVISEKELREVEKI
ncbi:MAG: 8-oxo-dGTP diphosphatase [Parcubacteria group bacterium]